MTKKTEKSRDGVIILEEDFPGKMEVEDVIVDASDDPKKSPVYIFYNWCKKCGICVAFCPTGCLGRRADGTPYVKNPEKCIHCETCDRLCPDFAITGSKDKGGIFNG
ncbi:MAG: 4Fe-4S binding protein [Candidatus Cloacimonas sp.]|jgi:2-oxoglutarate ferredoxin oxidoreductase subunit delta|nr:4Fe-4S binding protein [Candidatus Cloacimonadota bacterium]